MTDEERAAVQAAVAEALSEATFTQELVWHLQGTRHADQLRVLVEAAALYAYRTGRSRA